MLTPAGHAAALRAFLDLPLTLRLFVNADGPPQEASDFGYAPIRLDPNEWTEGELEATYPEQLFRFDGPLGYVYGRYVTDASGDVLDVERFADGPRIVQADDSIAVTLTIRQRV